MVLGKINCQVVSDTLEALVMHLGRVAEADNRMDIENLGLLFGQVMIEMIQKHFIYLLNVHFRDFFGLTPRLR